MSYLPRSLAACALCSALLPAWASAESSDSLAAEASAFAASGDFVSRDGQAGRDPLAVFAPSDNPIRHRIDYEIWDWALKNTTLSMGPPNRKIARRPDPITGTRTRQGPQSQFRLEGSLVFFPLFNDEIIASFTEYREDLERVAATLDIASLPRNEQLAFWLNLHNVAVMEQVAKAWPVREPREIELDGVPLDDAKFIGLRGIPVSLRDIREKIVFRHWEDPKVIYGFWRGDIGGPELRRNAFTGANVGSLLDVAALDYINSLRASQKRGDRLAVATLYEEVAPFYFPDFENDLRDHLATYAEEDLAKILAKTSRVEPVIREHDIADAAGGSRPASYLFAVSNPGPATPDMPTSHRLGAAITLLLRERQSKIEGMRRRGQPTYRIFFSKIELPGDPPNKNAVR